ncbi:hypothetical protein K4749_13520 [Streptomyces sp. TRM72054]|nr:hypothetical protein [Streptomyces sp. TRM72054]MBX9394589.1 hypothetical protein [Streptomyces sp. TRM72054]
MHQLEEVFRSLDVPAADEIGNMFQYYGDTLRRSRWAESAVPPSAS